MISTGRGASAPRTASSVRWPAPVAARLPNKVTRKVDASSLRSPNCSAARLGAIVWLLDGPMPIRKSSLSDFMSSFRPSRRTLCRVSILRHHRN
jgi:hypothetical protein